MFLCVDDLLVTGSCLKEITKFKASMKKEIEMTNLGKLSYFLGLEFLDTYKGITLHQMKYTKEVLSRFDMTECNYQQKGL